MKVVKAGAVATALTVASATLVTTADDAEAQRWRGRSVAGAVVGGLALGALLGSRSWGYGPGYYGSGYYGDSYYRGGNYRSGYRYRPTYYDGYAPRYYRSSGFYYSRPVTYQSRPVTYQRVYSSRVRRASDWCD